MTKSQKVLMSVSLLTVVILSTILFIYLRYIRDDSTATSDDSGQTANENRYVEDTFSLDTKYLGENIWTYTLTGTVPTPCHKYSVEEIVMESYPEQVYINVSVKETDEVCAQIIQKIEEKGSFQASEEARISLNVL